jgi:hypothetical protein
MCYLRLKRVLQIVGFVCLIEPRIHFLSCSIQDKFGLKVFDCFIVFFFNNYQFCYHAQMKISS